MTLNQITIINELFKDKSYFDVYINSLETLEFYEANLHKVQVRTLNLYYWTNFMTNERREQWAYSLARQKSIQQISKSKNLIV